MKDLAAVDRFRVGACRKRHPPARPRRADRPRRDAAGTFNGTGLVVCNPPWQFAETLSGLLAGLAPLLAQGAGAGHIIDEIAGE